MENKISSRQDWVFDGVKNYKFTIEELMKTYINKFLTRTNHMFKYDNLPDSIPQKDLELILQVNGNAVIAKVDDKIFAFRAGLGGQPNPYYLPTMAVVANPALNFSKSLKIDEECVVILNDTMYTGLLPYIKQASYLLAETDISFKFASINMRVPAIVKAPSDEAKKSGEEFFRKVEAGESLGLIMDEEFYGNIDVYNYASGSTNLITQLIELKQYVIGSFYNEIGLQAPFNMKRESLTQSETTLNEDVLYPLLDDMLFQRQIGIDKVNKMFGTNISVDFDSVWKQLRVQENMDMQLKESQVDLNIANANAIETSQQGGNEDET